MAKRATRTKPEPTETLGNDNAVPIPPPVSAPAAPETAPPPRVKAAKIPPGPVPVLACRMSPELAARIKNKFQVTIPIPKDDTIRDVMVGARLFLREWVGGPTGRADLAVVVATGEDDGEEGYADRCTIERRWCWLQGKTDDDVSALALSIIPDHFPLVGY